MIVLLDYIIKSDDLENSLYFKEIYEYLIYLVEIAPLTAIKVFQDFNVEVL